MTIWSARPLVTSSRPRTRARPGSTSAQPATFGSPGSTSFALAFGAPDPSAPSGVGNLGEFIYVGTATGQIYVSQNAGGSWTNISAGLAGSRRPADHHRSRPGQPRRLCRHRGRRLLHGQLVTSSTRRPGSTSPTASINWPIPSSARAMPPRPTPTPCRTTWPSSSTRSRPTGTTRYPIIPTISARDIIRSCTSPPTRAFTCRPTTARRPTAARPGLSSPTRRSAR